MFYSVTTTICRPRKPRRCSICDTRLPAKVWCVSVSGIIYGEGPARFYYHPECIAYANAKFTPEDWEESSDLKRLPLAECYTPPALLTNY